MNFTGENLETGGNRFAHAVKLHVVCDETNLLSEWLRNVFLYINYVVLCNIIACFGMFSNVVSILVYWRQGFAEAINVSLFALSITDLWMLVMVVLVSNFHLPRLIFSSKAAFFFSRFMYFIFEVLRLSFSRISIWITVLITVERCMCVLAPLKVRAILTPLKLGLAIAGGSVLTLVATIPVFMTARVEKFLDSALNQTFSVLVVKNSGYILQDISVVSVACMQILSLVIIVTGNAMLLVGLKKRKQKWVPGLAWLSLATQTVTVSIKNTSRAAAARGVSGSGGDRISTVHVISTAGGGEPLSPSAAQEVPASSSSSGAASAGTVTAASRRDRKLSRMVVILSGIHLMSFLPSFLWFCFIQRRPEFKGSGRFKCLANVVWSFLTVLETLNASVNILVYYHMSTRYRENLHSLLSRCQRRPRRVAPVTDQDSGREPRTELRRMSTLTSQH